MHSISYRALYNNTPGVALRDPEGRVHFADDATGLWRELTNADAPALLLLGRLDLIATQQLADGPGYTWIERRNTEHTMVARMVAA